MGILNAKYIFPKEFKISEKMQNLIHLLLVTNPENRPDINLLIEILN
jgi:hypothetical protein